MTWMTTQQERPHWNAAFNKPIVLRDGTELRTLQEASAFLADNLGWSRGIAYAAAYRLLCTAAETGRETDVYDARRMVELLLETEQMI